MSVETLGPVVADWIEANLVHGPGDVEGAPIVLDADQRVFLARAYALKRDGRRQYRRAFYSAPKGRAKSELAAMVACAEGLGPVRMGPSGPAPVSAPVIPCVATEANQASSALYEVVAYMLANGRVSQTPGLDVGLTRAYLPGSGVIHPVSAKATSKDGGRETFVPVDETHLMSSEGLRALHRTLIRNLAKRKAADPWMLEVGTMYAPGEDSVAERTHASLMAIEDGSSPETGLHGTIEQGPEPDVEFDWSDDAALRAAFADAYGDAAEWIDLDRLVAEARDPNAERDEIVRYFLNRPAFRGSTWVRSDQYDARVVEDQIEEGAPVALGWRGRVWDDSACLVAVSLEAPGRLELLDAWHGSLENPVDHAEVSEAIEEAFERFEVVRMYADPDGWETTLAQLGGMYGKRLRSWRTNRYRDFAAALESMRSAIRLEEVEITADALLRSHFLGAQVVRSYQHLVIQKPSRHSTRRIDAAVAGTLAWSARTDAIAAGEGKRKRSRRMVAL
jgi:hypothetical protein